MNNIAWDYSIPLTNENALAKFELENNVKLPQDLKECIENNNAGMPNLNIFNTDKTKGRTIKALLSFNREDEENIYDFLSLFMKDGKLKRIPFALDSFGNFICLEDNNIVIWLHETDTTEYIAKDFTEFLNLLYGQL
jgi:hypothetical protein